MTFARQLSIFLVLLQVGLVAARTHNHDEALRQPSFPHLHGHDLFDSFKSAPGNEAHQHQDHDADAVDLSHATAPASPPQVAAAAVPDLTPLSGSLVFVSPDEYLSLPLAPPPLTAGSQRPLHLLLCHFRN